MTAEYKIGLISDTHGRLPRAVKDIFKDVNAIIHAGDVGSTLVMRELEELAPVTAVRGNCDFGITAAFLEDVELLDAAGHKIAVMHGFSQSKTFVNKGFSGIIVFGHTHNPQKFERDGIVFINPGSASQPRLLERGTVAILYLHENATPTADFFEIDPE